MTDFVTDRTGERGKMTDERLREIQERLDKATPGPWYAEHEIDGVYSGRKTVVRAVNADSERPWAPTRVVSVGQTRPHISRDAEANADFIAHAPEDYAFLLVEIERLKPYEPCDPCKHDDHDNCTGDCPSMCCALSMSEAECSSLRVELTEARLTVSKLSDRCTETFAQLSAMESFNADIRATLNDIASQRDALATKVHEAYAFADVRRENDCDWDHIADVLGGETPAQSSTDDDIKKVLNDVALQRDSARNIIRGISAIHRAGVDNRCEGCREQSPCSTMKAISGETS